MNGANGDSWGKRGRSGRQVNVRRVLGNFWGEQQAAVGKRHGGLYPLLRLLGPVGDLLLQVARPASSLTCRYFLDSEGLQRVSGKACGYAKAIVDLIARECSPCVRPEEPIDHAMVVS